MVLIDTSVWLRGLAGREPFFQEISRLLEHKEALGHDLVYGELLIGDKGARHKLLKDYQVIRYVETASHEQVVQLTKGKKLHGRGVSWIDVHLLASALLQKVPLWTADFSLHILADELGVAYSAPA